MTSFSAVKALEVMALAWGDREGYVFLPVVDRTKQWRTALESDARFIKSPAFYWPDDRDAMIDHLEDWADKEHHCLYWSISVFAEKKGEVAPRREYALPDIALWSDLDKVDPHDLHPYTPSAAWATSGSSYQAFWLLTGPHPRASYDGELNQALTYKLGADENGWHTAKLLRVPGSANGKPSRQYDPEGKILWIDGPTYDYADFDSIARRKAVNSTPSEIDWEALQKRDVRRSKSMMRRAAPITMEKLAAGPDQSTNRDKFIYGFARDARKAKVGFEDWLAMLIQASHGEWDKSNKWRDPEAQYTKIWDKAEPEDDAPFQEDTVIEEVDEDDPEELKQLLAQHPRSAWPYLRREWFNQYARTKVRQAAWQSPVTPTESLADWLERPPQEYWLDKFIPKSAIVMLYAREKQGKSFFGVDWALSIATGHAWDDLPVEQGKVLYIVAEGQAGFGKRILAWGKGRTSLKNAQFHTKAGAVNFADEMAVAELATEVASEQYDFIVVDTVNRCAPGVKENDSTEMGVWFAGLSTVIAANPGCSALIIHHGAKAGEYRGSTTFGATVDAIIALHPLNDEDPKGPVKRLVIEGSKDAEGGEYGHFSLQQHMIGRDAKGKRITSCTMERNLDPMAIDPKVEKTADDVLDLLEEKNCSMSKNEIAKTLGGRKITVNAAVDYLLERGDIVKFNTNKVFLNRKDD